MAYSKSTAGFGSMMTLLTEMMRHGIKANERSYTDAIVCAGQAKQLGSALRLKQQALLLHPNHSNKLILHNATITACMRCDDWQQALALKKEMEKKGLKPDSLTYYVCIAACEQGGQWLRALELFDEMVSRSLLCFDFPFFLVQSQADTLMRC
jgi:pentatricopeptide repeat protein